MVLNAPAPRWFRLVLPPGSGNWHSGASGTLPQFQRPAGGLPRTMRTITVLQEAARRHNCPVGPIAARLTEPILRGLI